MNHIIKPIKQLIFACALSCFAVNSHAQSETRYFNGIQYVFMDGQWKAFYNNKFFPVINKSIIKYKTGVTELQISNFEIEQNIASDNKKKPYFYSYIMP